jgi:hypothetical protein
MAQDALVKKVLNRTRYAKGAGMSDIVRRVPVWKKSSAVLFSDTTVVNLFELPGNVFVNDMFVRVTTPFDASGTSALSDANITMPNDTGTETLWSSTTLVSTGFYPSTTVAVTPASGGLIIMNYTAQSTTAGQMEIYISYVEFDDEL